MRCRHTVPDWHRYVAAGEGARPIFAACRLLVKEEERARDPQSVACSYWGRQWVCPLYDGPEPRPASQLIRATAPAAADVPVALESVWPVRPPDAMDWQRILLLVLGGLSVVLLGFGGVLGSVGARRAPAGQLFGHLIRRSSLRLIW
jgi:hypothetical protein